MRNKTAIEWTPKQGEQIWIKVFDNWSYGTYIGYDIVNDKHIAREPDSGGGRILESEQILPYDSNPNQSPPKQKTAMMEAVSHLCIWVDSGLSLDKWIENYKDSYLEKEKEQIINAYWGGLNGSINDYSESKAINNELVGVKYSGGADDYYNQTYLKEVQDEAK